MTALIQDGDLLVIYNLINGMITGGKLDVNADIDMATEGLATEANQTNGEQITQINKLPASTIISPTVTVDTAAYTAQDNIGGLLTLTDAMLSEGGTGLLQSLLVADASGQKPALEILIFNANPSSSTITDQAAISIHADDVGKIIRRISVSQGDYVNVGSKYYADLSPGSRLLQAASGSKNLYAAIVCTGTPDFVASTDLKVKFGILRD